MLQEGKVHVNLVDPIVETQFNLRRVALGCSNRVTV